MQIDWGKIFSYINGQTDKKTVEEVEFWRKEDPRNEEFYHLITMQISRLVTNLFLKKSWISSIQNCKRREDGNINGYCGNE